MSQYIDKSMELKKSTHRHEHLTSAHCELFAQANITAIVLSLHDTQNVETISNWNRSSFSTFIFWTTSNLIQRTMTWISLKTVPESNINQPKYMRWIAGVKVVHICFLFWFARCALKCMMECAQLKLDLSCNKLSFSYYWIIYEFIYSLFAAGNMNGFDDALLTVFLIFSLTRVCSLCWVCMHNSCWE